MTTLRLVDVISALPEAAFMAVGFTYGSIRQALKDTGGTPG